MADVALGVVQWVVAKALAPVADGVLEAWAASRNFGPNIEALRMELLLVQATLENATRKELGGPAMEMLLQKLRDSAHNAEDLLDELDYFRIHDDLHGTYDAANQHGEGGVHDLALNARHSAKAVGKLVNCCPWQCAKRRQRSRGNSSSTPDANQEVSGCMSKLSKLLLCSFSPDLHVRDEDCNNLQETPKLDFDRVGFSQKMKDIVEKLQPVRKDVNGLLQSCEPRSVPNIAQCRPITKGQIDEPKLYGRDQVMNRIIHDITKGQYHVKGLTVLPVVGSGGMGKTTLVQHIYRNQQVLDHFSVRIWICVSLNFNLDKVVERIKACTPEVENEKKGSTAEELIEQRLKSKRFLLVLDDIWQISNGDDWGKLLLALNKSQEKGSMILVTTRFPAIAQKVKTTGHSIKLDSLESEEFRKLFLAFIFGNGQCARDKHFLLETGDKIIQKLKGSPLAAKTVGRLLSKDLSLLYWKKVLNNKGWEKQTDDNEIMPALKLSYDFLPFHLQQCFAYSALFPEDYHFRSEELISLWIGLDILIPTGQNQTFQDIGLSNLNELVIHGFFREDKTEYGLRYVMHDLLHDLALKVASYDCLSLRISDVGSMEVQPSIRHLSISTYELGEYDAVSGEKLKSELEELKTKFKVNHLQTLMLFGEMVEGFVKIFGDFFGEANTLRALHLPNMLCPVESILHNFSGLVHLRYLCLGTKKWLMHIPLSISKFYHLRILNFELWDVSRDLPENMSNLAKLCHFYTPSDGELHSDICNVGKLKLLEELKVFRVNKKSEGFEPKQLEHLTKLRELGIYNLEKIDTAEEAAQAKLMEKRYLRRLTLEWDSERSSVEPGAEAEVLESLQPHGDLQVLCIRGHGGPSCPTWLGDELAVEALQALYLDRVSWEVFPSLGKAWDLRVLKLNHIAKLKEFIIEKSFFMLIKLELHDLESFEKWVLPVEQESSLDGDSSSSDADIFPCLQVLIISWCPKLLVFPSSKWFPKLQRLVIRDCPKLSLAIPIPWIECLSHVKILCVLGEFEYSKSFDGGKLRIEKIGGKKWTEFLPHLPRLSNLVIQRCENIKRLLVGVDVRQTTSEASEMGGGEITVAAEEEDDGVLLFPAHLCDSLRELKFFLCEELVLVDPPTLVPGGGGLQALRSLQRLTIEGCPKFLSTFSFSCHLFPSSLQVLELWYVEGMGTLEPLSNLSSLIRLKLRDCGEGLKCKGLESLLTTEGQLNELDVIGSAGFFAGWDPKAKQKQLVSSTLQKLCTDDTAGFLAAPICSFLSSSLTKLVLRELKGMECFSKEQEDALQLLAHLQILWFMGYENLQQLPAGLCNLTSLKILSIFYCSAVSSLPSNGLPKSLQELNVSLCDNRELKQQCKGLVGTIPRINIH